MSTPPMRLLLAGETWSRLEIHTKGFTTYFFGGFGNGAGVLIDALRESGIEVTHVPNHTATEEFPTDLAALREYDVVALSDIGADTLLLHPDTFVDSKRTPDRLELLGEFVAGGGGLIMVGGWMSFSGVSGHARYQSTALAEVLPVEMLGYDDRVETPAGVTPTVADPGHEILQGVPADWPFFLGYNRVVPKPDAEVLLEFKRDSLLVVGTLGRGRVAAFTSDCSPHWAPPEMTSWAGYRPFWENVVRWLGGGGAA